MPGHKENICPRKTTGTKNQEKSSSQKSHQHNNEAVGEMRADITKHMSSTEINSLEVKFQYGHFVMYPSTLTFSSFVALFFLHLWQTIVDEKIKDM